MEAARLLAILREEGPAFRLQKTLELSGSCRRNAIAAYRRLHPDASPQQEREWMFRACYGDEFSDRYLAWRAQRDAPAEGS